MGGIWEFHQSETLGNKTLESAYVKKYPSVLDTNRSESVQLEVEIVKNIFDTETQMSYHDY